jgi:hypothetical protein
MDRHKRASMIERRVVEHFGRVAVDRMAAVGRLCDGWETPVDARDAGALVCLLQRVGLAVFGGSTTEMIVCVV